MASNKNEIAAIVMEPLRNESPIPGFFDNIRKLADEAGTVLIIDEISAGFRMNTGGAHLILGIQPDIAVFSKALGNGYSIAAIVGKSEVMEAAQKSFISSTNWTERTGPAAAIAMIRKHRQFDVGSHLMKIGTMVQEGWKMLSIKHGFPIDVGGIPPLSHFVFNHEKESVLKALFIQNMLGKGFLASTLFYSMYAHQEEHVERYLTAADEAFGMIRDSIENGHPEDDLLGQPSVAGFKRLN
jgi:glutamate-1-semialdehyde 2,1-aminomutase